MRWVALALVSTFLSELCLVKDHNYWCPDLCVALQDDVVKERKAGTTAKQCALRQVNEARWPWAKIQIVPPVNIPIPTKLD